MSGQSLPPFILVMKSLSGSGTNVLCYLGSFPSITHSGSLLAHLGFEFPCIDWAFGPKARKPITLTSRSRAIARCENINPIRNWNSDRTRRSNYAYHYGSQSKSFLPLNEHWTTGARWMRIAIGEPKVLIMRHQVTPKLSGQHVPPVGRVSCMDQRNVGALNLGPIEFQWSNVIEIVVQCDQHNVSQKRASSNILQMWVWKTAARTDVLVIRRKMETLGSRMTKPF
jgi:hypothetical protein